MAGYESRYEVSTLGRVWSKLSNRILSPGPTSRGYLTVNLYDGSSPKKAKSFCVHRLVIETFVGPCPDKHNTDHIDGNKANNCLSNLEYVTVTENNRRAVVVGLHRVSCGIEHYRSRLTEDDIRRIRSECNPHVRGVYARLAREYGMSEDAITSIARRESYKNIT